MHVLALYLPQFHPIKENNEWWGMGFTEWTNVAKSKPLFNKHYQPKLPADLGFYDLRVPEVREHQAELAREYGVTGFCYYHYWFNGRRLLERPFNEVVKTKQPDFPFCLCWANESWRGVWHGAPNKILLEQTYGGMADINNHFYSLLDAFIDDRYIKIKAKPLFFIYKPWDIEGLPDFINKWNELAIKEGLQGIHFVAMRHPKEDNYLNKGLYNAYSISNLPNRKRWVKSNDRLLYAAKQLIKRAYYKAFSLPTMYDYNNELPSCTSNIVDGSINYPIVIPNWDNTARSGIDGMLLLNSTPSLFKKNLEHAIDYIYSNNEDKDRIIIIKSWNEWAEGNYLEPDMKFGKRYLEVIKESINQKHSNVIN